jgi:hypothetical protein
MRLQSTVSASVLSNSDKSLSGHTACYPWNKTRAVPMHNRRQFSSHHPRKNIVPGIFSFGLRRIFPGIATRCIRRGKSSTIFDRLGCEGIVTEDRIDRIKKITGFRRKDFANGSALSCSSCKSCLQTPARLPGGSVFRSAGQWFSALNNCQPPVMCREIHHREAQTDSRVSMRSTRLKRFDRRLQSHLIHTHTLVDRPLF